jgi:hypothetical protein
LKVQLDQVKQKRMIWLKWMDSPIIFKEALP